MCLITTLFYSSCYGRKYYGTLSLISLIHIGLFSEVRKIRKNRKETDKDKKKLRKIKKKRQKDKKEQERDKDKKKGKEK